MPRRRNHRRSIERATAAEKRFARQRMLREWQVLEADLPKVNAQFIRETRERLDCSRALFACRLCINERTLENWEQGRAKPNAQAALLIHLVKRFPDTVKRLAAI